jgi:hypothetical protein
MRYSMLYPSILRTFLRMYVEIGACVWAFATLDHAAAKAAGIIAAYHLGALGRTLAEQHRRRPIPGAVQLLPVGLVLAAFGYCMGSMAVAGAGLVVTGFLIPASQFAARGESSSRISKILAKLFGMTAPAILPWSLGAYAFVGLLVSLLIIWRTPGEGRSAAEVSATSRNPVDLTNVFHQAGYFAFCFSFWGLASEIAPSLIAVLFPVGWVAYWALELRLSADPRFHQPLLSAGHLAFAVTLLVMAASLDNTSVIVLSWFLTGLFGGTCYTMEHAPGGRPSSLSDNLGAVLGSLTGTLAIVATGQAGAGAVIGAGFACATALAAFYFIHTSPQRG